MDRLKQEFQDMGMFTHILGTQIKHQAGPAARPTNRKPALLTTKPKNSRELFLEKTDKLNKMQSHRDALNRAVAWDKLQPSSESRTNP